MPAPAHPSAKNSPLPSPGLRDTDFAGPPPLPPRPTGSSVSLAVADEDSDSETNEDERPSAVLGASTSTVNLLSSKDEEALSEIQLRELYDDEEIDRFLHLFSTVSTT